MQIKISGYAVAGGGRGIERVDVSVDGGKTWMEASRYQKTGIPYIADDISSDKWAWVLFEFMVDVKHSTEIVAKAVCYVSPENNRNNLDSMFTSGKAYLPPSSEGTSNVWLTLIRMVQLTWRPLS